jgi:stage III sporulation protein AD
MELQSVIGFSLCAAALSVLLRQYRPEHSLLLSIGCGVGILIWLLGEMAPLTEQIRRIASMAFSGETSGILLRSLGICLITQIACDTCRDVGEGAIAARLELAGKAAMLLLAAPMFVQLLEEALALIK